MFNKPEPEGESPPAVSEICGTCRSWHEIKQDQTFGRIPHEHRLGACRAHPPTVVGVPPYPACTWPEVAASKGCGEWERRFGGGGEEETIAG